MHNRLDREKKQPAPKIQQNSIFPTPILQRLFIKPTVIDITSSVKGIRREGNRRTCENRELGETYSTTLPLQPHPTPTLPFFKCKGFFQSVGLQLLPSLFLELVKRRLNIKEDKKSIIRNCFKLS